VSLRKAILMIFEDIWARREDGGLVSGRQRDNSERKKERTWNSLLPTTLQNPDDVSVLCHSLPAAIGWLRLKSFRSLLDS